MQGTPSWHGSRRQIQSGLLVSRRWLAWLLLAWLLAAWPSRAQQAVQFFPDDVPATAANVTQRLIFRTSGLRQFWDEEYVTTARLQERIVLSPDNWQQTFAATGGVAVLSPSNAKGGVFRITSGSNDTQQGQQYTRNWLDFSSMAGAMLVESGGRLLFDNVGLQGIAPTYAYKYSVQQPYRNAGVGYALWPTILLAPNATVSLRNVSVSYIDPSNIDTPEQYSAKVVFGIRQQYGSNSVTEVNSTAATVVGPLIIPVLVLNGSMNSTPGNGTANTGNESALAYAYYENVTFNCEPWPTASTGLSGSALAAAIAVPVVVGVLLLAGLAAWGYRRRRRKHQAVRASQVAKDIEAGRLRTSTEDVYAGRDQQPPTDAALGAVYVPGGAPAGTPHGSGGSSTGEGASGSTDHTGASATTPSGAKTPIGLSSMQRAAIQNSSAESNEADFSSTGAAQGPTYGFDEAATAAARPDAGAAAAAAAAAFQAQGLSPATSRQLWQNTFTASRSKSGSGAVCLGETSSYDTVGLERASTDRVVSEDAPLARRFQHTPPMSARDSLEIAGTHAGTTGSARSSIEHPAVIAAVCRAGSAGRGSGGSTRSIASQRSGLATERSGSGGTTGALGDTAIGSIMGTGSVMGTSSRALDRQGGMSALLKARSELAVLRDLKIGPLLGRGSYGRVYKGRWKAVTVAVKIIEHSEGSPGTTSSGDNRLSVGRETFVATNISHPNVVQTYHISTMTISQRNTLASTWLKETASSASSNSAAHLAAAVATRQIAENDDTADIESSASSQSSQSSGADQPEILETWMLLEFCEKCSLHKAIQQGKFIRKDNHQPDMIGIYKALLDTASGLDYLHSIGVVHGDLKTANVLLKGSARDVRGFACKIADFGLSRVLDMDATHISTRTYGTIVYMPAELLLSGRMTTSTDIYSFGLMMWELFTSQPVFEEGLSVGQIFYMIAYQNWRPVVPPNCPPGYAQLMTACWHQNPEQRPTVQQLLRGLQRLYVAEKQRVIAAKQAAAAAGIAGTSTASSSRPSTAGSPSAARQQMPVGQAVATTTAVQATAPAAPLAVVAPVAQQAAASAALAVAAFAAAPAAPANAATASSAAGLQPDGFATARASAVQAKEGDRTSFESTSSDRYVNAAAASEASIAATGLPQWSYPGQLTPSGIGATPIAGTPAEASPADSTPQHSSSSGSNRPSADNFAAAAAAARAAATAATSEAAAPPAAIPEPTAVLSVSSYQPNRQSFGSSVGSAGAAQGSEGAARSSGGTAGAQEEYQPWAHAVSEEGLVRAGSRMLATRQRSAPLPGHWMGRPSVAVEQPQQQGQKQHETAQQLQQQQAEARRSPQLEVAQMEQQQQESRLGALLHQALGTHAAPEVAGGAYGPLHLTSDLPPIDDNEPIEDTIPSESLFPPATMSSSNNAVFGNPDDLAAYEDTSGFLAAMRRAPAHAQRHRHHQLSAIRPVGPAAQSFVEALDMVAGHAGANQLYYQLRSQAPQHVPYAAGAPPGQLGGSSGGTVPPDASGGTVQGLAARCSSTPSSLLPESISRWGSSGVTTGTMPSVLADDRSTVGGSSLALRSSGGTLGAMSRLGTQDSNWQPSSSSSLEGRPAAVFSPPAGYGYGVRPGAGQNAGIASPFSPTNCPPAAVVSSSTAASPFAQGITAPIPSASDAAASPFAQQQGVAAPAVHGSSAAASPFAQQQTVAAPAAPASSSAASPFAQAAGVPVTHAAPVPPATPAGTGRSPFAVAAVRPPHVTPGHTYSPVSSGYGTAGSSSAGSTPERQRTPPREIRFLYRTPSGKVIMQSRSTGTLQTVREGSGPESKTSSGTESQAGSGTTGSKADSAGTGGSRAASLYPAASQDYAQRHRDGQQASPPQQGLVLQPSPQQGQRWGAGGPAPSPFAALAQRAGSLFEPG